jgi:hypothetical protein
LLFRAAAGACISLVLSHLPLPYMSLFATSIVSYQLTIASPLPAKT